MSARVPIIHAADEGEKRRFSGGGIHTWKLTTDDTDGASFVFEETMTRGKCTPLHLHPEADEMVYVVDGRILLHADGEETAVGEGGLVFTPKGVTHAFLVVSETARLLTWQTPGIGQGFYRDASDSGTGGDPEAVDIARLQASAQDNPRGVTLLGPPPFAAPDGG